MPCFAVPGGAAQTCPEQGMLGTRRGLTRRRDSSRRPVVRRTKRREPTTRFGLAPQLQKGPFRRPTPPLMRQGRCRGCRCPLPAVLSGRRALRARIPSRPPPARRDLPYLRSHLSALLTPQDGPRYPPAAMGFPAVGHIDSKGAPGSRQGKSLAPLRPAMGPQKNRARAARARPSAVLPVGAAQRHRASQLPAQIGLALTSPPAANRSWRSGRRPRRTSCA